MDEDCHVIVKLYYVKQGVHFETVFGPPKELILPMQLVLDDAQSVHAYIRDSGTVVWFCVRKGQDKKRVERAIITMMPEAIEDADQIL